MNDSALPRSLFAGFIAAVLVIATVATLSSSRSCSSRAQNRSSEKLTCAVFPPDNVWNTPIDKLPVDAHSAAYIASIGADRPVHPDFGSGTWNGGPIGIPYVLVPVTQPKVTVSFEYADQSDPGPYPIPANAPIEGGKYGTGDRHAIVIDKDQCVLYEIFSARQKPDGTWTAGSGAIFNLNSNRVRPIGWTSADAAGLPIFPGLIRYEEVATGQIRHALRFTAPRTRNEFVWPATHFASRLAADSLPPLGQRFRLKAGFDIKGYSSEIQVILQALKRYGMFLADNGSPWFLSGTPDAKWNDGDLHELRRVRGNDFEAVDEFSLRLDNNTAQVRANENKGK